MLKILVVTSIGFASAQYIQAEEMKEIALKGMIERETDGRVDKPAVLNTAEELEKALAQKDLAEQVLKQVDFTKQKLVFFAWAGSGQDRLHGSSEKDVVTFNYQQGRTRDLRQHFHLFAIPKDATFTLKKGF